MSSRRATLAALALPLAAASAQNSAGLPRIGLLWFGDGAESDGLVEALEGLGHIDGRTVRLVPRAAHGRADRLAELAAELVALPVRVIVAGGPAPLAAARRATSSIPIVVVGGGDPVAAGWAQSLARPGGNVTGLTVTLPELAPKQLELLQHAHPALQRVVQLAAPAELHGPDEQLTRLRAGARRLGITLRRLDVAGAQDFEPAFESARKYGAQGLMVAVTNTMAEHAARLAALAAQQRLVSIADFAWFARAGFTMSYGADLGALLRRSASYVDRILKGAQPGELPIERPQHLALVVNVRAARNIGLALPSALLLRADEVIE